LPTIEDKVEHVIAVLDLEQTKWKEREENYIIELL